MIYTLEQVRQRADKVVAERGADYIYGDGNGVECIYFKPIFVVAGEVKDWDAFALSGDQEMIVADAENNGDLEKRCNGAGCLVGAIIEPWLTQELKELIFHHHNDAGIGGLAVVLQEQGIAMEASVWVWLSRVQARQDEGVPWGDAVTDTDAYVNGDDPDL